MNSSTKMRVLLVAVVALSVAISLALVGCGGAGKPSAIAPEISAEETVKAALDSYIEADVEGFYSYLNLDEPMGEDDIETARSIAKTIGPETSYEILASNESLTRDEATVRLKITAPNPTKVSKIVREKVEKKVKKTKHPSMSQVEVDKYTAKVLKKTSQNEDLVETTELFLRLAIVNTADGVVEWKIIDPEIYTPLFGEGQQASENPGS